MWHERWDGLPSEEFLTSLDPLLAGFRARLFENTATAEKPVGKLCPEWAERLGLSTDVVVAGSAFDCHMGAVGAGVKPHTFVRVIGTSTCDIMIADSKEIGNNLIRGICRAGRRLGHARVYWFGSRTVGFRRYLRLVQTGVGVSVARNRGKERFAR